MEGENPSNAPRVKGDPQFCPHCSRIQVEGEERSPFHCPGGRGGSNGRWKIHVASLFVPCNCVHARRSFCCVQKVRTLRNSLLIPVISMKIRYYLPFSDWLGTKQNSVWFQITLKMGNNIWFALIYRESQVHFCVCMTGFESRIWNYINDYASERLVPLDIMVGTRKSPAETPKLHGTKRGRRGWGVGAATIVARERPAPLNIKGGPIKGPPETTWASRYCGARV